MERSCKVHDFNVVAVTDQDGNDVEWMSPHPACYVGKIFFGCASIQKIAGGMAVVHCVVDPVGLALKHADSIIELSDNSELLVCRCIIWIYEWAIMGCHLSDITVFPAAKLGVVVTGLGICRTCGCGGTAVSQITRTSSIRSGYR